MIGAEAGFLLLTSGLGNPQRKVLTTAQLRILSARVQSAEKEEGNRQLTVDDLVAMGYGRESAEHMITLLSEEELLHRYCQKAQKQGCAPLARVSDAYPDAWRKKLGWEAPGCVWYKGDLSLLTQPTVALVGSRDLLQRNRAFAVEVGKQAAKQGYTLVSGNARGADQAAQNACLRAGGSVISVVADSLAEKNDTERVLYISEDDFDAPFTAQRAISRNRLIHALAQKTFVAQCRLQTGGTWDGTVKNLRHGWSTVFCFDDGSPALKQLVQMGAEAITAEKLRDFTTLQGQRSLFDE